MLAVVIREQPSECNNTILRWKPLRYAIRDHRMKRKQRTRALLGTLNFHQRNALSHQRTRNLTKSKYIHNTIYGIRVSQSESRWIPFPWRKNEIAQAERKLPFQHYVKAPRSSIACKRGRKVWRAIREAISHPNSSCSRLHPHVCVRADASGCTQRCGGWIAGNQA